MVMKINLGKNKYKSKISSYSKILMEFFPEPYEIYHLVRKKKMTKLEAVLDFATYGIHDALDVIGDLSPYYLVTKDNLKLLVNIKDWVLEVDELSSDTNTKKFTLGQNNFINCGRLKLNK